MTQLPKDKPLPPGWRWAKLGEVCEIVGGSTPKSGVDEYWNGHIPWITPTDLAQLKTKYIDSTQRAITQRGYESCSTQLVPAGSVVMSSRAPIGYLGIATMDLCTNQGCKTFVSNSMVEAEFLYRVLLAYMRDIQVLGAGSTFPEVSKSTLLSFRIPLPPLEEQRRIVAELDAQLALVERARSAAEEMLEAACALPRALMGEILPSKGQHLPHGWRWAKLGEVCEFLDYRRRPINQSERNTRKAGKSTGELYPYYGANGQVDVIDDYLFDEPAVLLAEDGGFFGSIHKPIAYIVGGKYWVNNHAHVLRPTPMINVHFLHHALRIRPDVGSMVSGSTRGKLNQEIASSISIPLPPLDEQQHIVAALDARLGAAESARCASEQLIATIDAMRAALMRQAFAGAGL